MSYVEEPAGLEGYAAYEGQQGNMQDEWMRNYFQPTGFAPVQHHHAAVDNGLYASYASDVSDISVASIAEDMYDPALIPQGFEAPVIFDQYAYGGYNPAAFMHPHHHMHHQYAVHEPRQMYRTVQVPQYEYEDIYVEDEGPMMMQQNFPEQFMHHPEQHYVQQPMRVHQPVQARSQVRRVHQHQLPSQAQLHQGQGPNQWAPEQRAVQTQRAFAPGQRGPPVDAQMAQVGISIWQKGSWHVIASVTPGSSAQTQGLLPGDVLRKLDRVSVKGWDHDKIMAKLQGWEGTPCIVRTNTKKLQVIRDCAVVGRPVVQQPQPQPQPQQQFIPQPVQQPVQQPMPQPVQQFVQQPVQQRIIQQPVVQQPQIQFVPQQQHVQVQHVPVHQPQQFIVQQQPQQFIVQQPMQQQVIRQVVQMPQQQFVKQVQVGPGQFGPGPGMMPGQPMMMQF